MKFADLLKQASDPAFQRRYDKACRDWDAVRNLREAAAVIYGGRITKGVEALIKLREGEVAERGNKGKKLVVAELGTLKHDGERFVGKKKTLVYPKAAVEVEVDPELAEDEGVAKVWGAFCGREKTLVRELESAIAKYYSQIRKRPNLGLDPLPALARNSDVWATLGKPTFAFRWRRRKVELELSWGPEWEDEHGLYVYLSSDAKIRHVGESD